MTRCRSHCSFGHRPSGRVLCNIPTAGQRCQARQSRRSRRWPLRICSCPSCIASRPPCYRRVARLRRRLRRRPSARRNCSGAPPTNAHRPGTRHRHPAARRRAGPRRVSDARRATPSRQPHRAPARSERERSGLRRARLTTACPPPHPSLPPLTGDQPALHSPPHTLVMLPTSERSECVREDRSPAAAPADPQACGSRPTKACPQPCPEVSILSESHGSGAHRHARI
jgi:hypothetical protein